MQSEERTPQSGSVVIEGMRRSACSLTTERSRMSETEPSTNRTQGPPLLKSLDLPNLAENSATIGVAIVNTREAVTLTDSIETLLGEASGFICARFEYRGEVGIEPRGQTFSNHRDPDVVVVTINTLSLRAHELRSLFNALGDKFPHRPVIATLAQPDTGNIFQLLEMGATDFVLPPLRRSEFLPRLLRQAQVMGRENLSIQQLKKEIGLRQIIGESRSILDEMQRVPRFAQCDATVLISGESGTGKEIFARAIHYLSPRADQPFVPVNCGALPEHLMESEIFGHKRGAFTGATSDQSGLIREAEAGTLFLDEIDALTPQSQVKLLRFLQDGEYRSVGSQQIIHANIRVVAAANANFRSIVREGKFREDLFYRLNVLALALPALRERGGDIILLARHFLDKQAALAEKPAKNISLATLKRLLSYSWPGNVRELENVLTRAVVLSDRDMIEPSDLNLPDEAGTGEEESFQKMKKRVVRRFEHDFLESILRAHDGNITHAAFAVKKNRRAFWQLLRKHGLLTGARRN